MAAVLACGVKDGSRMGCEPSAILSHHSAAALWGIRHPTGRAIDVTTPSKSRSTASIRKHYANLPVDEVTTQRRIPVTTVPRTLFDLAAVASVDVVENALRESEYLRLYDRLSLPDLLARYPGRRGACAVRECLARRVETLSGRTRSRLEARFLSFLRRHRLPRPDLNVWLQIGARSFQVDCLWPGTKVIVELDGYAGHGTLGAFREDRARDRVLGVAGYGVTRITWAQLEDEPDAIAVDLRALLGK
jgi:very-short-patch-repair endonuclease